MSGSWLVRQALGMNGAGVRMHACAHLPPRSELLPLQPQQLQASRKSDVAQQPEGHQPQEHHLRTPCSVQVRRSKVQPPVLETYEFDTITNWWSRMGMVHSPARSCLRSRGPEEEAAEDNTARFRCRIFYRDLVQIRAMKHAPDKMHGLLT